MRQGGRRARRDGKTARTHAAAIHAAGITSRQFDRARKVLIDPYSFPGAQNKAYLSRVGSFLRRLEKEATKVDTSR